MNEIRQTLVNDEAPTMFTLYKVCFYCILFFRFRLMFDVVSMPKNWPVECNYHEAKAFCKWKGEGFRMLSEAEEHAIRDIEVCSSFGFTLR